jgi:hypothetical protein
MCGLCGSFTQQGTVLSKRDRLTRARTIEGLLIANQSRGTDSTGVAAINFDGTYTLDKIAVRAEKYVDRPEAQSLLRRDVPIFIGHTRMTSMGNDVTDQNAHPFVEGKVIGAHNGVINNYMELDKTVNVDSQAVFRMLDKHPDAHDYVFDRVSGSCALTWYDQRDPTALYLVAHMNPLSAAIVPRIDTVYWSSESDHLETVMRVAYGSSVNFMEIKKDTIYRLDGSDIYQWAEAKTSFASAVQYTNQSANMLRAYGYDEEDWMMSGRPYDYKGLSASPKAHVVSRGASLTVSKPSPMTQEEEDRYEKFWDERFEASPNESDDDSESTSVKSSERIHDTPDSLFDSEYETDKPSRFHIDDIDGTLMCGYCDKSLGDGGAWDDGLQMLLCKYCQRWWDDYGHYTMENVSEAGRAIMLPAMYKPDDG